MGAFAPVEMQVGGRLVLFHETTFSSLQHEGSALFALHWLEASANRSVPLDVDWDSYRTIEQGGSEVCIAARIDGVLVGYAVYLVGTALHYRGQVVAQADAFFLRPEDRIGWIGIKLFQVAEDVLRLRGVSQIQQRVKLHVKPGRGRSDLGRVFRYLGYAPVETWWWKKI